MKYLRDNKSAIVAVILSALFIWKSYSFSQDIPKLVKKSTVPSASEQLEELDK